MIGKVLDNRYEIIKEIGNGGMAQVYKARCRLLNRFVAIKVLRSEFVKDNEFLSRFNTEAQAAAALSHHNIVSIYDVGRENDIEYIVMEYVEGLTLKEYIKQNKLLSWQESVSFTIQICRALNCAHKNGIIHRDIKPQNIILTSEGVLKVTDFGIARAATVSSVTITGNTMGSVHYLSPEQAKGGYTDAKSDIYSLGIVMYEMVTGRLPFEGDNPVTIAIKQIQEKPVSPKEYNLAVPLAIENIILKAMNKDQAMRYQTANEMLDDLEIAKVNPDIALVKENSNDADMTKKIPVISIENSPETVNTNSQKNIERRPSKEVKSMKKSEKKAVIWAIVTSVIIVSALVVGAVNVFFPGGGKTKDVLVPELVGKMYDDVKDAYAEQGITITFTRTVNSDKYAVGEIVEQSPKEGKLIRTPYNIDVVVSEGVKEFKLDNYKTKGLIEVKLALESKGLVVKEDKEENETYPEGIIIRTIPRENSTVKVGDTVTLVVSSGISEKMVLMPNLVTLSLQQAKKTISDNDLLEGDDIIEVYSDKPKGSVIEQSITANTQVKAYTKVNLTVSKGLELKSRAVTITVPPDRNSTSIKVVQDGIIIHEAVHNKSEEAFNVTVSGIGSVIIEIYYDGTLVRRETVPL